MIEQDNSTNSHITIYGNVVLVGSISFAGVGFLFLGIWMVQFWAQAVLMAAILVYTLAGLASLAALALVAALWVRMVYLPVVNARPHPILHAQENCIVTLDGDRMHFTKLLPEPVADVVEAEMREEVPVDVSVVLELYEHGSTLETIAKSTGLSYYKVQKIVSGAKDAGLTAFSVSPPPPKKRGKK